MKNIFIKTKNVYELNEIIHILKEKGFKECEHCDIIKDATNNGKDILFDEEYIIYTADNIIYPYYEDIQDLIDKGYIKLKMSFSEEKLKKELVGDLVNEYSNLQYYISSEFPKFDIVEKIKSYKAKNGVWYDYENVYSLYYNIPDEGRNIIVATFEDDTQHFYASFYEDLEPIYFFERKYVEIFYIFIPFFIGKWKGDKTKILNKYKDNNEIIEYVNDIDHIIKAIKKIFY